jgi:hypothetical protein
VRLPALAALNCIGADATRTALFPDTREAREPAKRRGPRSAGDRRDRLLVVTLLRYRLTMAPRAVRSRLRLRQLGEERKAMRGGGV